MALFKKRDETKLKDFSKLPELPQLPELPELPENEYSEEEEEFSSKIPQLPRFSNDSPGRKFSQNTIKEAVTGKKEDGVFADEFDENEEYQMMQKPSMNFKYPLPKKITNEFSSEESPRRRETGPIFVRMDKFQEGLNSLEGAKKQIFEIEKLIKNIREIKEAEEKELESWERQIQVAKSQIDKVDKSVFSRLD